MSRNILFDPDLVIPRKTDLSTPIFWSELVEWVDATPGARMGKATYIYFVNNLAQWLDDSRLNAGGIKPLLTRIASAVLDSVEVTRSADDCSHLAESYLVRDRAALLVDDLKQLPATGLDIATVQENWSCCSSGQPCYRCKNSDIRLYFSRDASTLSRLGESSVGEVAQLPIAGCETCLHDARGNHYAEDVQTKLYWTRDNDGHGGVVFKTYVKTARLLRFEADRDIDGYVITAKHKGPKGASIRLSGLAKCVNPGRHSAN